MATFTSKAALNITAKNKVSPAFKKMSSDSRRFGKDTKRAFSGASSSASNFGSVLKGILASQIITRGLGFLKRGIMGVVGSAAMIEDMQAAFTPLLGGAEKAQRMVDRLNKEAASTPFQLQDISDASKQLLPVMNGDINKTAETFRMLGDTAGGNAQKLQTITRGFTKSMLKGKVDLESLNMIAEAGVPIFSEMAESMDISKNKLFEMVSAGKVTTDQLTNTFKTMTSEGGTFYKGMEVASKTFSGLVSTLKDNINLLAASFGSALLPILKDAINSILPLITRMRDWTEVNKDLIKEKVYGWVNNLKEAFKAIAPYIRGAFELVKKIVPFLDDLAVIVLPIVAAFKAWNIALAAYNAILGIVAVVQSTYAAVTGVATTAQTGLNAAMYANPIGLVILAIAALIGIVVLLVKNFDTVKKASLSLWEALKSGSKMAFDTVKNVASMLWGALKTGFIAVVDFMKKIFFTFADYFLTIWGNIIKGVLGAASKLGGVFGMNTSAIDNVINKVDTLQKKVRSQSFAGDIQANIQAPNQQTARAEVYANQSLDINVNNNTNNEITTRRRTPRAATRPAIAGAN